MGGEFELLEHIIQHIQFFLGGKEAARTTVLSKAWRSAWLTRPNLDFDETDFRTRPWSGPDPFVEFRNTTIKRYEESNTKIESFKLRVTTTYGPRFDLANELIVRALKIGATHLHLQIDSYKFNLPHEVFGAQNLVQLSVDGCKIDIGDVIRCSRLESISLSSTRIDLDSISFLITSCPKIEKLSLSNVFKEGVRSVGDLGLINLQRLTCLVLQYVEFDTLFLGDLSSKFPSLKDLTLHTARSKGERGISSCSLERLNFVHYVADRKKKNESRFKFDVPSIHKFTFQGRTIPSLSFRSTTRDQWESRVSITSDGGLTPLWFRKLDKFLTKLRRSKIHLSLTPYYWKSFDYAMEDKIQGFHKRHELENLTVDFSGLPSLSCYALFDGIFRICRPKLITQNLVPKLRNNHWRKNNDFLCKILIRGMNGDFSSTPINFMNGLHDLEEVNAKLYDEVAAAWMPISLESLLEASKSPESKQKICFQLKWKTVVLD